MIFVVVVVVVVVSFQMMDDARPMKRNDDV